MAFVHAPAHTGLNITARFNDAMQALKTMRTRRAAYNRCYNELAVLTERELSDIGISRTDIPAIAAEEAAKY